MWATEELESGRGGKPEVGEGGECGGGGGGGGQGGGGRQRGKGGGGGGGGGEGARAPVSHLFSLASLSFLDFCVCH